MITFEHVEAADIVAPGQELTLSDIDALHAKIEAFIDQLVAEEKQKTPDLPVQLLRGLLMRGQCPCAAARRILEQR
jgi:hypothetical protein